MSHHKLTYRAFDMADFARVDLLEDEKAQVVKDAGMLVQLAPVAFDTYDDPFALMQLDPHFFCGVALLDGEPLFISGYDETQPGSYRVFVIPDRRALSYPKLFHSQVLKVAHSWLESLPWCWRMYTISLPLPRIEAWMRALGYLCLGQATGYTGYNLWSREKVNGIWRTN